MTRLEKEKVLEKIRRGRGLRFGERLIWNNWAGWCRHNFGYGIYMDGGTTQQANKKLQELQFLHCTLPEVWISNWLDGCHQFAARRRFWNQKSTKIWFSLHRYIQQKCHIVPIENKDGDDVYKAVMEWFILGQPLSIYSDDEGALNSKKLQAFFYGGRYNTRNNKDACKSGKRMIRTVTKMIGDRLRHYKTKTWV